MTPSFWKYLLGSNTTIISERGGHCFFIQKTDETLAKARVKKNKTQIVFTLSKFNEGYENELHRNN